LPDASNPLLEHGFPVPFDRIKPDHVVPAVESVLEWARARLDRLAEGDGGGEGDGDSAVLDGIDEVEREVDRVWAPVSHLANVMATPELRKAHATALPEIVRFGSNLYHHEGVYRRLQRYARSEEGRAAKGLARRHLAKTCREFRRAGAGLAPESKAELENIRVELSELSRTFEENLLEETAGFAKIVTDRAQLAGLPETAIDRAAQLARDRGEDGWLLTLDMPAVQAVLMHAENRALRRAIHTA